MSTFVGRMGEAVFTVPASSRVAVFSSSPAKLYVEFGPPNHPGEWMFAYETVAGEHYVSAAATFTGRAKIVASGGDAWYEVGTAPYIKDRGVLVSTQGTPSALVGVDTLTPTILQNGIITLTHAVGATVALTLATGVALDAAVNMAVDESFDWYLINLSAAATDTGTITGSAAHTIVGNAVVESTNAARLEGSQGHFRTRKTAAATFVTYRIG